MVCPPLRFPLLTTIYFAHGTKEQIHVTDSLATEPPADPPSPGTMPRILGPSLIPTPGGAPCRPVNLRLIPYS